MEVKNNNNNSILEIDDLEVIYKTDLETVKAVNGINLKIRKGETCGLVGETGAGKTTTALSILRLLPENTGRIVGGDIKFKGKSLLDMSPEEMRNVRGNSISMVFQDPMSALNPVYTVGDQIGEAIKLHNPQLAKEDVEKRVEEMLELVGIVASRKNDYPHQFSGGMKQRVVIAIALCCEPDLLIADEPTTALDVTIQAQVLAMIANLRERLGTSMLMITHDLGVVAKTCDNVCIMYAGKIVEAGTIEDVFSGMKHHPYTEGLFASIPNIKTKSSRLKPIKGLMPDPTNLPQGCAFYPRCEKCMDVCKTIPPGAYHNGTHSIFCHQYANQAGSIEGKGGAPNE